MERYIRAQVKGTGKYCIEVQMKRTGRHVIRAQVKGTENIENQVKDRVTNHLYVY